MLNFTRTLLKLRREHAALANAADFSPCMRKKISIHLFTCVLADSERLVSSSPSILLNGPLRPLWERSLKRVHGIHYSFKARHSGTVRLEMDPVSFGIFAIE